MCDPITLMAIGGSALGSGLSAGTASKNALKVSRANNRVLDETLEKNRPEQEAARGIFDERLFTPEQAQGDLANAQMMKRADFANNLAGPAEAPMTGRSTPKIIQNAFVDKLAQSFERAGGMADRQGDLAGYSKMWSDRGFGDRAGARDANVNLDRIRGNLAILPDQQQFAVSQVRPDFDWGALLSGVSGMAGRMGGGNIVRPGGPTNIVPRGY